MQKKIFLRIVACVLTLTCAISVVVPVSASDISVNESVKINFGGDIDFSGDNIKGKFKTNQSIDTGVGALEGVYYYRDAYFTAPSTTYNAHLATMSMALTMSSFWAHNAWNKYMQYDNAAKLLGEIGFEHIEANTKTDGKPTEDTIGVLMAHKTIYEEDGKPYNLVSITIRSSSYGAEWANNMMVGQEWEYDGNHKGFSMSRDRALEFIIPYLEKYIDGDTKFWITGYSRGGAVSGLLGMWFDDNVASLSEMNVNTSHKHIFTYTFEAPASVLRKNVSGKNYRNIFNIFSSEDPITYLPMGGSKSQGWDFVQPGVIRKYAPVTAERMAVLEQEVKKFNPYLTYTLDEFAPFMNTLGRDVSTFLTNFSKAFAAKVSRSEYASSIERDFAKIVSQVLAGSTIETRIMFEKLGALAGERLGISGDASPAELVSMLIALLGGNEQTIDSLCLTLGECMEEVGAIEVYDEMAHNCIKTLLMTMLSTEGGNIVPYIITFITNDATIIDANGNEKSVNVIISSHAHEYAFAALTADDIYYRGATVVDFREAGSSDAVTVTVNASGKQYQQNYKIGTNVTLCADVSGCYGFEAWYLGGELVSKSIEYSFEANESTTLDVGLIANHVSLGDWITEKEASDDEDGLRVRLCSSCGDVAESMVVPRLKAPADQQDSSGDLSNTQSSAYEGNHIVAVAVLSVVAILALGGGMGLVIFAVSKKRHNKTK